MSATLFSWTPFLRPRAPVDASQEDVLRRVDLRHSDQGDRIAGQDGAVGPPVAVQKSTGVDGDPEPARENFV